MLGIAGIHVGLSAALAERFTFDVFEFAGTWAALVCVWLCRTENVLCWPWGIASVLCLGVFFGKIGLPGQQWLNWGFFLVIQIWSWQNWLWGGKARTELRVGVLSWPGRIAVVAAVCLGTVLVHRLIDVLAQTSSYPWLDAVVVASSVVAQVLLGAKKVESWALWLGPVNLVSILLFYLSGAYLVMALYAAFFLHAAAALLRWRGQQRAGAA